MLKKLFTSLIISICIYLTIALVLSFLPVNPSFEEAGLDFSVLDTESIARVEASENYFQANDNQELFYRSVGLTTASDTNMIIVLLHGSGSEGRYLMPLAEKLSVEGTRVVIPDLRGHGLSINNNSGDVAYLGQFKDDMDALFEHLRTVSPAATMVLGGHSSGGGFALEYASGPSNNYNALLLLAPYLGHKAPTVRPNSGGWVYVAQRRYAGLAMLNNVKIRLLNHLPVLFFNRPADLNDEFQVEAYSYRLNESFALKSYEKSLENLPLTTLVLVGTEDESFYVDEFEAVLEPYGDHIELHLIEGAQHLNITDDAQILPIINEWLPIF